MMRHSRLFWVVALSVPSIAAGTIYLFAGGLGPNSGWPRPGDVAISAAGAENCRAIV